MCAGALADALLELANGMRLCQHLRYALYLSVHRMHLSYIKYLGFPAYQHSRWIGDKQIFVMFQCPYKFMILITASRQLYVLPASTVSARVAEP